MRISDGSSDVCSSDLMIMVVGAFVAMLVVGPVGMIRAMIMAIITMLVAGLCRDSRGDGSRFPGNAHIRKHHSNRFDGSLRALDLGAQRQIGRASCRERAGQ